LGANKEHFFYLKRKKLSQPKKKIKLFWKAPTLVDATFSESWPRPWAKKLRRGFTEKKLPTGLLPSPDSILHQWFLLFLIVFFQIEEGDGVLVS